MKLPTSLPTVIALGATAAQAIDFTLHDDQSIKEAASTVAYGLMKYYTGNNTGDVPGNLPDPYYWWEAGAMFGSMIDYWWLTGDDTYNQIIMDGTIHQAGDDGDFMPTNQTRTEGNDDQGFWAFTAMAAAERKFPDPPNGKPQWLALAQAVFKEFVTRWDDKTCQGGLRWQIFQFNNGFDYKNSISNGCFFNIAARLARYTGNETYGDWAEKVFDWERHAGLISEQFNVYDGTHIEGTECKDVDKGQWSYNSGVYLLGSAVMYNLTEKDSWKQRTDGFLKVATTNFFRNNILYESFCEEHLLCDQDQQSFKGYLLRWLAETAQVAPWTTFTIQPLLDATAENAASCCTGPAENKFKGHDGTACGFSWLQKGKYDGLVGIGSQMDALSAMIYTLLPKASPPVTHATGGTSKGDADAGSKDSSNPKKNEKPITTADRAGAGILTALVLSGVISGCIFVII